MAGASGIRAGRSYVELILKDKLSAGLKRAQAKLKKFSAAAGKLGGSLLKMGAAAAMPLIGAGKAFADFESSMAAVSQMIGGETGPTMDRFSKGVRRMAVEFGESTDTLAKGLYDILSASVPAEKALDVLAISAKAAQAGLTDTGTAADAITTLMNSFGQENMSAAQASDLLFAIVKRGKTTFSELSAVIGDVTSIAASAGVSAEDLGASLATMTRNGVKTDKAVTALRAMISSFVKPAKEANDAFNDMFGSDMSVETLNAMGGISGVLQKMGGMKLDDIGKIFPNVRAIGGVAPILNKMAGFEKDLAIMSSRAGETDAAFEKMAGTFKFAFNKAKALFKDIFIVIGGQLAPLFLQMGERFTEIATRVRNFAQVNGELFRVIALGVGVTLAVGAGLVALAAAVNVAAFALTPLIALVGTAAAVITGLVSPLGLVGVALAGGGFAFTQYTASGATMLDNAKGLFNSLKVHASQTMGGITDALKAGDMQLAAKVGWTGIKQPFITGWNFLKEGWAGTRLLVTQTWANLWNGIMKSSTKAWGWLKKRWVKVKNFFGAGIDQSAAFAEIDALTKGKLDVREKSAAAATAARSKKANSAMLAIQADERKNRKALSDLRLEAANKRAAREAKMSEAEHAVKEHQWEQFEPETPDVAELTAGKPDFSGAMGKGFGATSAAAVARMGGKQNRWQDRVAVALESIEGHTKKSADFPQVFV